MAILTGDLAFALANRLAASLPAATRQVWNDMLTELTAGQFLDLSGGARHDRSPVLARTIARLKSGRYTVTGPLRLGATLAGHTLPTALERYGDLIGEAFRSRGAWPRRRGQHVGSSTPPRSNPTSFMR